MTLEEAIKHCKEVADSNIKQVENEDWKKDSLTERACIECANEHRQLAEWLKELKAYRNKSEIPTSCGDAISRQAAIRAIEALQLPIMREESDFFQFKFSGMSEAREAVENLPSVTPQQRTGRWNDQTLEDIDRAFKALEERDELLDKIRAEIEQLTSRYSISKERGGMGQVEWSDRLIKEIDVLQIIEKYKEESEDK